MDSMYTLYMTATHYGSMGEARAHLKELLNAAESGRPATLSREGRRTAVVDADRLRDILGASRPSRAVMAHEAGGWSIVLPGLPIAADGPTVDQALDEMVDAMREYADDWTERLLTAPNHARNWDLVQLIELSDDEQLRNWLVSS
jgi:Antitoxin of toxin-antitoxin, RelE / RelB, TA system